MRRKLSAGLIVVTCVVLVVRATPADAQHRGQAAGPGPQAGPAPVARPVPGPGPAHGPYPGGPRFSLGFYYGPYYGPYYYSPWFYPSFWWGWPYGYASPYPYYYGAVGANIRVQVQPKNAEVYVDGHLAGIVDRFDGMFQSLVVEPGNHEITICLDGYRSIVQRLYLSVGSSYKIRGEMEKLAPGQPNDPRPAPEAVPLQPAYQAPPADAAQPAAAPPGGETYAPMTPDSQFGQIAIRVQPREAEIRIDGEVWQGAAGAGRLVVHLAAGTHRVEIREEGFDPFVTAVEIRRGEVTVLNVSLAKL